MSRNTPLTSTVGLLSNAVCVSCIIENGWANFCEFETSVRKTAQTFGSYLENFLGAFKNW